VLIVEVNSVRNMPRYDERRLSAELKRKFPMLRSQGGQQVPCEDEKCSFPLPLLLPSWNSSSRMNIKETTFVLDCVESTKIALAI